jgi:hypothetical protein
MSQLRARLRDHEQPQKGDKGTLVLRTFVKVSADVVSSGDWLCMEVPRTASGLAHQKASWRHENLLHVLQGRL